MGVRPAGGSAGRTPTNSGRTYGLACGQGAFRAGALAARGRIPGRQKTKRRPQQFCQTGSPWALRRFWSLDPSRVSQESPAPSSSLAREAAISEESLRIYCCALCRAQVEICSRCDHGNIYCLGGCSALAREESCRRATARYQASPQGARAHARRQKRYRCKLPPSVTHQGPPSEPTVAEGASETVALTVLVVAAALAERVPEAPQVIPVVSPATLAGGGRPGHDWRPETLYRCQFCGRYCRLLRNDFHRQRRRQL